MAGTDDSAHAGPTLWRAQLPVSHLQSVPGYHNQVLEVTGDGLWALHVEADYRWT